MIYGIEKTCHNVPSSKYSLHLSRFHKKFAETDFPGTKRPSDGQISRITLYPRRGTCSTGTPLSDTRVNTEIYTREHHSQSSSFRVTQNSWIDTRAAVSYGRLHFRRSRWIKITSVSNVKTNWSVSVPLCTRASPCGLLCLRPAVVLVLVSARG